MKIIGIDKEASSTEEGMGDRYLILEDYPPAYWGEFFSSIHSEFFSMQKRRARLEGNYIVVTCLRSELQAQINDLNVQCKQATEATCAYVEKLRAQQAERDEQLHAQRKAADNDFDNLKFD